MGCLEKYALLAILEKRVQAGEITQGIEAVAALGMFGLNWRFSKIPRLSIQGGREEDMSGMATDKIRVYRKSYFISEMPDGTFEVRLWLDNHNLFQVPTLGEAVLLVIRKYRGAGLL
jgi:hypothetical protein